MSGYEKTEASYVYGYAATRSDHQQSYDALTQPPASLQYQSSQAQVPHGTLSTAQMPFIPVHQYGTARDVSPYRNPNFPLTDVRTQPMPEIVSYIPSNYSYGTKIIIQIRSQFDLTSSPGLTFTMMLGSARLDSNLNRINEQDHYHYFAISARAPQFQTTGWTNTEVPISLEMWDHSGFLRGTTNVGSFSYSDTESQTSYSSSPSIPRKRKFSTEGRDYRFASAKRPSTQQLRSQAQESAPTYESAPSSASPPTPFVNPGAPALYAYPDNFGRHRQPQHRPSQHFQYHYSHAEPALTVREVGSPAISGSYESYSTPAMQTPRTTSMSATPANARRSEPSSSSASNPQLVRTSTLQPSPTTSIQQSSSAAGFNPYAMYPSNAKATLKVEGDLETMMKDWNNEEREASRRLVQFSRQQSGSVITTTFQPISLEKRATHSICISCIWWEDKQECYVTSVDTIHLLESLIGVRFTVEEKNRIRRNLEGFRPATVSKAKADSEEFFKIIMGFPNPKPRNIEKDVKVFPWRILGHALKKIISKYSASYSSTASAIPPPANRSYGGSSSGSVSLPTDPLSVSPRSRSASHGYESGMTSSTIMPDRDSSAGLNQVTTAGAAVPADFRAPVSPLDAASLQQTYGSYHPQQQQQQHQHQMLYDHPSHQSSISQYPSAVMGGARQSWDMSNFLDPTPVAATPGGIAQQALQQQYGGLSAVSGSEPEAVLGAVTQAQGVGPRSTHPGLSGYGQRSSQGA